MKTRLVKSKYILSALFIFFFLILFHPEVVGAISYKSVRELTKITLTWSPPNDYDKTVIIRNTEEVPNYISYEAFSEFGDTVYEGRDTSFVDNNIEQNLPYYYALYIKYKDGSYSKPTIISAEKMNEVTKENNENDSTEVDYDSIDNLGSVNAQVVELVSLKEGRDIYLHNTEVVLNNVSKRLVDYIINKSPHSLSQQDEYAIAYFIHDGTPTTFVLGAGERTGVVDSYLSVFDKLPRSEKEWQDVIKIANGRWPSERNIKAEEKSMTLYFTTIYHRDPNMKDPHDNAAVTVITYGLRPAQRNLSSEESAINIFKKIYNKAPSSAIDWDIVRAIAYSGAIR